MTHRIGGFHNATSMAAESPETELMGIRTRESGLARASAVEAAIRKMKPHYDALIACEDNLKFMRPLESGSIQLVVTSPPYNIGKKYESKSPLDHYIQAQARVIAECVRLLHAGGSLCWQVGNHVQKGEIFPLDLVLYPIFREHGLKLRNRIVWHFEHGLHCSKRLSGRYETILWFTKGDDYVFNLDSIRVPSKYPGKKYFKGPKAGQLSCNPLGKNPGDVWIGAVRKAVGIRCGAISDNMKVSSQAARSIG